MAYTDVCGKKLRSKLGAVLNESAVSHSPALLSSEQSFAKRQLEKMGWTEGTGLGKRRDGLVDHVKIKQREDEMGLGREKMLAKEVADVWWKDSVGGTLARLQKKKSDRAEKDKKKKNKKKDKKKDKSKGDATSVKTYTDEELFEATGGARFGMRAQRRAEGKWKRTESGNELMELEKKAKASMEWNGRGKADVSIKKGDSIAESEKRLENDGDKIGTKQKKRKQSDDIDKSTTAVSPSVSDVASDLDPDSDKEERRLKKKRRKEEKEEKKRSKIHNISPPASEEDAPDVENDDSKKKEKRDKKKKKKRSKEWFRYPYLIHSKK